MKRAPLHLLVPLTALVIAAATACSSGSGSASSASASAKPVGTSAPPCPVEAIPVVVSVDQWGDITQQLAGACGQVTTIISGSSADPHEYEPTPADSATFSKAKLVVMNGLDYDAWAGRVVDTLSPRPPLVNAGEVAGLKSGANPHLWYSPEYVQRTSDAITAQLSQALPGAAAYFGQQNAAWKTAMKPYLDTVQSLKPSSTGSTYGATEPVFTYMADAIGLRDLTPDGYRNASANQAEASPGDLSAFQQSLRSKQMSVLIFNTQTEGAVPDQIKAAAESAGVPVVDVTETVPPGASSFLSWQMQQLDRLRQALGTGK